MADMPWLTPFDGAAIEAFEEYDGLEFTGLDLTDVRADNAKLLECRLGRVLFEQASLARGLVADSEIVDCRFVGTDISDTEWRDVTATGTLLAGSAFTGSRLLRVRFTDCKLTSVNLRAAALSDVTFERCILTDVDLAESSLTRVAFAECQITALDVTKARFDATDFRTSELDIVRGLLSLRGATMDLDQLLGIAPAIAADLGITLKPTSH